MVYRKGERTAKHNEREGPHIVIVDPPDTCRGAYVEDCHRWHRARGLPVMSGQRPPFNGRERLTFCFADPAHADAFAAAVWGERWLVRYKGNHQRVILPPGAAWPPR